MRQCNLATIKIFCTKPVQNGTDTQVETVVKEVLHNNYQSRNLIGPPRVKVLVGKEKSVTSEESGNLDAMEWLLTMLPDTGEKE